MDSMISLGNFFDDGSCSISYNEIADGNTFCGYDLTHHLRDGMDAGPIKNYHLSVAH